MWARSQVRIRRRVPNPVIVGSNPTVPVRWPMATVRSMETRTIGGKRKPSYGVGRDDFVISGSSTGSARRATIEVSVEAEDEREALDMLEEIREKVSEVEDIVPKENSEHPTEEN